MTYNSQRINRDPYPWVTVFGIAEGFRIAREDGRHLKHDFQPRPEFDNNPNPILAGIREGENDACSALDMLRGDAREWWNPLVVTDAHIDHARKVLERLAAL